MLIVALVMFTVPKSASMLSEHDELLLLVQISGRSTIHSAEDLAAEKPMFVEKVQL